MADISIAGSEAKKGKTSASGKPGGDDAKRARNPTNRKKATPANDIEIHEMIRREAYFRSERRGFAAGADVQDWLEAESEIKRMLECQQPTSFTK